MIKVIEHLPVLQVILPLLAAPLCLLINKARLSWYFSVLVSWLSFAISCLVLLQVQEKGTLIYEQGAWSAPIGIVYHVDILSAYVLLVISAIAALAIPYAGKSIEKEIPEDKHALFYTAMLLCVAGLLGIVSTGDAFNVFVFLEISSLSTYALLSQGKDRRSLVATFQYLVMGTVGGTFILIGVGLMYMQTGTLNMADLAQRLPPLFESSTIQAAYAFLTVGICLKLALFPLHFWLPNAYTYAPSAVSVFIAATSTKVAVYMLLRFSFTIFGAQFVYEQMPVAEVLLVLAMVGIIVGSVAAIYQEDVKRLLAFSSVAQISYIVLGISFASVTGLTGSIAHVFNHAVMKAALFMAVGAMAYQIGSSQLSSMRGIAYQMPWTFAAFAIGGLSIIGVPMTVGFISKWYLLLAAIENNWWPVVVVILIGSLLAIVYIWRVVEVAYFKADGGDKEAGVKEAPLLLLVPTWILVILNIVLGVETSVTLDNATQAAKLLMGAQ